MAASDNLNPDQLRMFMRPQEIMDMVTDSMDRYEGEAMSSLWASKADDVRRLPRYKKLKESISQHGVSRPVTIVPEMEARDTGDISPYGMGEGHHRVVIARQLENETGKEHYLPVVYDDTPNYTNKKEYTPPNHKEKKTDGSL